MNDFLIEKIKSIIFSYLKENLKIHVGQDERKKFVQVILGDHIISESSLNPDDHPDDFIIIGDRVQFPEKNGE